MGTVLVPRLTRACEVCYGQSEGPWIEASQAAVYLLLGVTAAVQISFVVFFVRMRGRAKVLAERQGEIGFVGGKGAA